jgi:RHS repeat-associated protein
MKKYLTNKIILLFSVFLAGNALIAQASNTENYISEKSCFDADCVKYTETISYFDGLGRAKQTVNVKASPTAKDVVTHFEYNPFGIQTKNHLPVPQVGTQNGAIYTTPLANASAIYGSEKIYSENVLENSPYDRIKQKIQYGNDWTLHPANYNYGANTVSDAVRKFTTTTIWQNNATKSTLGEASNYAANQLSKQTVTDEDGYSTIEFTNSNGQLILKRKEITVGDYVDTYYVYNEFDQLAFIIPSQANIYSDLVTNTTRQADLCYQYKYDSRYRMVEKKLPGKDWEFILYDKQDRVVGTQDANLKLQGRWLYTKYDQFGRVAITGIATGGDRITEQAMVDTYGSNNVNRLATAFFERQGMDVYYGNPDNTYPNSTKWVELLTLNYYDTYPSYSFNPAFPTAILGEPTLTQNEASENVSTKSLPVLSLIKNIENDSWTRKYSYYDKKGRIIGEYTINHLGGYNRVESTLDFVGNTTQTKTYHKRLSTDTEVVINEDFEYDDLKRLKKHWHQVNGGTVELLTDNTYSERSLLSNQKVGNNLQSIDYEYDVRGWMTKINDPANLGNKLFGYQIKYHNPDPILGIQEPKYNGNISEVDWKTANDGILKRYTYRYDGLNRLTDGKSYQPLSTALNIDYYETVEYDNNGNITVLQRGQKGMGSPTTTEVIDNLTYNYQGNRLLTITDASGNTAGYRGGGNVISYDNNGNMTSMVDKRIQNISYNFLNLPTTVQMNAAIGAAYAFNYIYSADGTKLRKRYTQLSTIIDTEYLDNFHYEFTSLLPTAASLKFVSTSEGYYSFENNKYIYHYKDQVGNIRVSYYKDAGGNAVIDNAVDYFPFGLEHGNIAVATITPSYRYGFQSQERQVQQGWSSFKWRNYDPSIGRFFNVDPLTEDYETWSPYVFSGNRVIDSRELEGLEPDDFRFRMLMKAKGGVQARAEEENGKANSAAFMAVIKTVTPIEELYTVASGRDLDGNLASRSDAAKLLAVNLVPVVKVEAKVATTVLKAEAKAAAKAEAAALSKAEARAAKLSVKPRPGKDFTKSGKDAVKELNKLNNKGKVLCDNCKIETVPGKKSQRGVVPPKNEAQVDHIKRKREGGSGTPDNGQVLCRKCNLDKH